MKFFSVATFALALTTLPLAAQTPIVPDGSPVVPGGEMNHMKAPVPPSKSINVTFEGRVTTLTVQNLLNLPQVTVQVHNSHRNTDESYTGPLLSDVLSRAGLKSSRETESLMLHSSVIATGSDHYFVLYSVAEVEPSFSTGQVIVAVMKSGLPNIEGGLIEIVNTVDSKPARWLHGLADLNIVSIAPGK